MFPRVATLFAFSAIISTVIRYLQYSTVIEIDNGFFAHGGGILNHAYYITFAVTVVAFIFLGFRDKSEGCGIMRKKSANLSLSPIASVIGAGLTAYCGFMFASGAITAFQNEAHLVELTALSIAALGYTFLGYQIFTHKKITPICSIAFLLIAANYACTASVVFMQRIYTVNLSPQLIILTVYLFLSIFFLSCGRIIVRSTTRFTAFFATICGYSLVILTLSDAVARLVVYSGLDVIERTTMIGRDNGFELPTVIYFAQAVTVLWFLYALSVKRSKEEAEEVEEVEEVEVDENEKEIKETENNEDETNHNNTSAD